MDRLESPLSKLDWAHEHLTTLDAKFAAFRQLHPYESVIEDHPKWGQAIRLKLRRLPPVPKEFSHRIGEFATALRASMDHLVWARMTGTPKNSNKVQFPIFDREPRYRSESPKQLSGVIPRAEPIIANLQPYKAPNPRAHPLWRVCRLSNTDKHRVIILAPHAVRLSSGPIIGTRHGATLAFHGPLDEDPVIPLPPGLVEVGRYFNFKVETLFAILLQNADTDTGVFMALEELPALYEYVRDEVFPPLKALVP